MDPVKGPFLVRIWNSIFFIISRAFFFDVLKHVIIHFRPGEKLYGRRVCRVGL